MDLMISNRFNLIQSTLTRNGVILNSIVRRRVSGDTFGGVWFTSHDLAPHNSLSSVQKPSIIPVYWLVYRDSTIGLL